MEATDVHREFARLMERDEAEINVAEAAFTFARTEYPRLDVARELRRLDELASQLVVPSGGDDPLRQIQALNTLLFEQEHFAGDEADYDNPENSYLNRVLDRRKGIPITLSVIYTHIARQHGIPIAGVGFPGHFLVKHGRKPEEIFIDPFHRGAILSRDECAARLKEHFGPEAELTEEYLRASTPKEILKRMLNNLKGSYFRRHNYPKVLVMVELSLATDPGSFDEIRERGMVYLVMHRYREAMADFQAYLAVAPQDDPKVREVMASLRRVHAMMN